MKNCPAPNVSDVASPWPPSAFNQHTHTLRPMGMNAQEITIVLSWCKSQNLCFIWNVTAWIEHALVPSAPWLTCSPFCIPVLLSCHRVLKLPMRLYMVEVSC